MLPILELPFWDYGAGSPAARVAVLRCRSAGLFVQTPCTYNIINDILTFLLVDLV